MPTTVDTQARSRAAAGRARPRCGIALAAAVGLLLAGPAHAGTTIGCDQTIAQCLASPLATAVFDFTVDSPQIVRIALSDWSAGPTGEPSWRILDGAAQPAPDCGTFAAGSYSDPSVTVRDCQLPVGSYHIQVQDRDQDEAECFYVNFQRLTAAVACEDTALPCDGTIEADFASPLDDDLYRFSATGTEVVRIAVADSTGGWPSEPAWRLLDPSGAPATVCGDWIAGSYSDPSVAARDCELPEGDYQLQIADRDRDESGFYRVNLQRLTAVTACEGTVLACDVTVQSTFASPIDDDLYRFDVTGTETVRIAVSDVGSGASEPAWRVLDATGMPAAACGAWTVGSYSDPSVAVAECTLGGGQYQLQIADRDRDEAGNYQVNLQRLTAATACETTLLPCDGNLQAGFDSSIDDDLYRFSVTGTEVVQIAVSDSGNAASDPAWRVLDATGAPATACGTWIAGSYSNPSVAVIDCTLTAGEYQLQVADRDRDEAGNYQVNFQRLTAAAGCEAAPLPCDTTVDASFDTPLDADLYQFTLTGVELVRISLSDGTTMTAPEPAWRLLDATGAPASACGTWAAGSYSNPSVTTRDCSLGAGLYQLEVTDLDRDEAGNYRLFATRLIGGCAGGTTTTTTSTSTTTTLRSTTSSTSSSTTTSHSTTSSTSTSSPTTSSTSTTTSASTSTSHASTTSSTSTTPTTSPSTTSTSAPVTTTSTSAPVTTSTTVPSKCGNGAIDDGEQCDPRAASSPCVGHAPCTDKCECPGKSCHDLPESAVCDDLDVCTDDDVCHDRICSGELKCRVELPEQSPVKPKKPSVPVTIEAAVGARCKVRLFERKDLVSIATEASGSDPFPGIVNGRALSRSAKGKIGRGGRLVVAVPLNKVAKRIFDTQLSVNAIDGIAEVTITEKGGKKRLLRSLLALVRP